MNAPAVISLGQVIVDLTMRVDAVPRPGEDVFADAADAQVGASFNMMHAVRRMGVVARHGGVIGSGPWATMIDRALADDGIDHIGLRVADEDSGYCIAMTDAHAERTFVSIRGAEAHAPVTAFDTIDPRPGDVVYISGYTLAHPTAQALLAFLRRTAARPFTAVCDASPMIGTVNDRLVRALADYRPIWTCNEREAAMLAERLGVDPSPASPTVQQSAGSGRPPSMASTALTASEMNGSNADHDGLCSGGGTDQSGSCSGGGGDTPCYAPLARALHAPVIVRIGAGGAWVCQPGRPCVHVPGFPVTPVDTNGAGDCHTGVLCACLTEGMPLPDAVRMANAAAAIAVTRHGPATCPDRAAVERLLAEHER